MKSGRRRFRWWCLMLAGCYVGIAGFAFLVSDGMLYQPLYGSYREPAGGIRIKMPEGSELAVLYLPNPDARYTLWYFHGNGEDLGDIEPRLRALHSFGFAVFAFDYPGYGFSYGRPSEAAIYGATRQALRWLRETHGVRPEQIVAYGRSLGGGPAVELAVREPVAGLVLECAFTSAYRVMTHWRLLPFDKFENLRKLPQVHCPVLVMHGTEDRVIPFEHGPMLYEAVRGPKYKLWVDFAGHNNFLKSAGPAYAQALREFQAALRPPVSGAGASGRRRRGAVAGAWSRCVRRHRTR